MVLAPPTETDNCCIDHVSSLTFIFLER